MMDIGYKGYQLSKEIDTANIEQKQRQIEEYKNGELSKFIKPFLQTFNNLVNLDYVIKSDQLEDVDYGEDEDELKDIKYGLITNSGILAFQYDKGKELDENKVFGFRNNIDFGFAINEILKVKDSKFKFITFDNLKNYYKKSEIKGNYRTCLPLNDLVKDTHLIFINPMKREFKVLPNKNHMLALQQIIEYANINKKNGDKIDIHTLEVINGILYSGTEKDGESGIGKFRDTNVRVGIFEAWKPVIIREVIERDYLGNPTKYNNAPLIKEVKELFDWYNNANDVSPIIKAAILNLEISRIQPFRDGNKRTARLFTNYELLRNGYPVVAFRTENKESYDDLLTKSINNKDISNFVEYLVKMIEMQQQAYLNEIETLKFYLDDEKQNQQIQENCFEEEKQ